MMIKMENQNPFSSSLPLDTFDQNTSFMDLLGFQDFYSSSSSSIFELIEKETAPRKEEDVSVSSPAAATHHKPLKQCMKAKGEETQTKTKTKKKKEKEREARFAFMTRTEIDHLDDGYRWRKYGQKPVKNSPFPRSYYRCTSASCNVKKRVERCMGDPSCVVTTYQGQHIHPTPSSFNSAPAHQALLQHHMLP